MSFKSQLIILFIFFKYISCELEEENMIRAFSCLNIISKKLNGEEEALSNSYSPYMLSCFIKITNEQMQTLLSGIEEGNEELNSLTEDEIEQLTDFESLKDIPENELKKYSSKLKKTMKKLEKMNKEMKEGKDIEDRELNILDDDDNYDDGDIDYDDDDYDDYDDDDDDDDYSSLEKKSKRGKGFFRILFRAIKKFFNNSNLWFAFLFLIIVYFLLLAMRKSFEEEKIENNDKEIKEKNEKENDNKEDGSKENTNKDNENNKEEKEKEKIKKD